MARPSIFKFIAERTAEDSDEARRQAEEDKRNVLARLESLRRREKKKSRKYFKDLSRLVLCKSQKTVVVLLGKP